MALKLEGKLRFPYISGNVYFNLFGGFLQPYVEEVIVSEIIQQT